MAGIRVNTGNIKIDVNDKGDHITLYKDLDFINKVKSFGEGLEKLQEEFNKKKELLDDGDTDAKIELLYSSHKELHDGIEALFGIGTCKKVFGEGEKDVIPTIDQVNDFLTQLTPYIQKLSYFRGSQTKREISGSKPKAAFHDLLAKDEEYKKAFEVVENEEQ